MCQLVCSDSLFGRLSDSSYNNEKLTEKTRKALTFGLTLYLNLTLPVSLKNTKHFILLKGYLKTSRVIVILEYICFFLYLLEYCIFAFIYTLEQRCPRCLSELFQV